MIKYFAFGDGMEATEAPNEFLLLKRGDNSFTISGKTGRFSVTDDDINNILQEFNSRGKDMVIDYDHSTLDKENAMKGEAPAGGWIATLKSVPQGIMAVVKSWTDKAKGMIGSGEYKYISPVIMFNPVNKSIMGIHSVGLTNHPAIHGATPISAYNDFDSFFEPNKAKLLLDDYKIVLRTIKGEADRIKTQLHDNINAFSDLGKKYEFIKSDITVFLDELFAPEMKAMNDMSSQIPVIAFSDINQEIANNKNIMDKDTLMAWIEKKLTMLTEQMTANPMDITGNAMLKADIDSLTAAKQQLIAETAQENVAIKQVEAPKTVIAANDTPVATVKEPVTVAIESPQPEQEIPIEPPSRMETLDNLIKLLLIIIDGEDDKSVGSMAETMKSKLSESPIGKMLFAVQKEQVTPVAVSEDVITKQELPLSDLGLTISSTKENVMLVMNDMAKVRRETRDICEQLKIVKFSDILPMVKKKDDALAEQVAINAVDKMMASPDCKIPESQRKWAIDLAKKDIKAFNDHFAQAPVYFGSNKDMKNISQPPKREMKKVFSDEQIAVAKSFGNEPDQVYK